MEQYAVVNKTLITIWGIPAKTRMGNQGHMVSAIADEGLYGMGLVLTGEPEEGFYPVRTFYGYTGYVKEGEVARVPLEKLMEWEESRLMAVNGIFTDIVSVPKVQGIRLLSMLPGSLIQVMDFESETEGWARVRLLDGCIGYMKNQYLREKEFSQAGLWLGELPQKKIEDKGIFRTKVVETANQYLGIQYRWGGRSTAGIDCSGLTSESYMMNGILICRDAKIQPGFPVHEIPRETMVPGDLMYFPGHIAMYMGNGRYIHSTARAGDSGVVVNSLNPGEGDYRADLAKSWYAAGSIF